MVSYYNGKLRNSPQTAGGVKPSKRNEVRTVKKRVFRSVGLCAMLLCLSLSLCGCMFEQSEGMYALPILPEAYSQLQSTIQDVMDQQGAEYATISSGSNTSTVQLLDLNGDGEQEMAAVFLRVTSAEEKPLRVCLFRKGADNDYRLTYVVEGDGTSINSVTYEDVTGDGTLDLIVSWQMSAKVHILSAYALLDAGVSELMSTTYNESYLVTDLDQDGAKEIVVCHQDSTGDGANLAEFYDYNGGVMTMISSAPLSNGIYGVYSMVPGKLADGTPAVFASSLFSGGTLTDVMTVADGRLHNVTLNKQAGYSEVTSRVDTGVSLSDINKDGVLEQKPNHGFFVLRSPLRRNDGDRRIAVFMESAVNPSAGGMMYHALLGARDVAEAAGFELSVVARHCGAGSTDFFREASRQCDVSAQPAPW